eukprot:CAMPEP_0167831728 /NCGR_PEP_ID=MMETSP0112_2-20121227/13859_1 /TAXON_ID=91324 /ORGANISM="Lotharella globosa, Strain CCCM811" /LENGTH=200 /DNA_ID=CAMNT_0007736531 /DNA_START=927 /DNA_END=1530 /DNA_ORIENTATION=+
MVANVHVDGWSRRRHVDAHVDSRKCFPPIPFPVAPAKTSAGDPGLAGRYERENLEYIRSIAGEGKVSKEEQASVAGNKRPIDAPTGSGPKKAKLESSIPELIDWSPPSTPSQDTGLSTPTEFAGDSKPWPDDLLVTDLKDYEPRLLEANPQPQKLEAKDFPTLSGLDDFGFDSLLRADAEYPPNLFDAALDTSPLGTALW